MDEFQQKNHRNYDKKRKVTRRQVLKAGGIAALGLTFSKPIIDTIRPTPVFAQYGSYTEPPTQTVSTPPPTAIYYGDNVAFHGRAGYMVAEINGDLNANRSWLRGWEQFVILKPDDTSDRGIVRYGDIIALRTAHGKHVVAEINGDANANRDWIRGWERFILVDPNDPDATGPVQPGDRIALKSFAHGKYLYGPLDGQVFANASSVREGETWTIVNP